MEDVIRFIFAMVIITTTIFGALYFIVSPEPIADMGFRILLVLELLITGVIIGRVLQ